MGMVSPEVSILMFNDSSETGHIRFRAISAAKAFNGDTYNVWIPPLRPVNHPAKGSGNVPVMLNR